MNTTLRIFISVVSFAIIFASAYYYFWPMLGVGLRDHGPNEFFIFIVAAYAYGHGYALGTREFK